MVPGWQRVPEGRVGQAPLEQISCPTYLKMEAVRRCSNRRQDSTLTDDRARKRFHPHSSASLEIMEPIKVQADNRTDAMEGWSNG